MIEMSPSVGFEFAMRDSFTFEAVSLNVQVSQGEMVVVQSSAANLRIDLKRFKANLRDLRLNFFSFLMNFCSYFI